MNIFVGSYTSVAPSAPGAKGKGIQRIFVDPQSRHWQKIGTPIALANPTYMAWIPEHRLLLSVCGEMNQPQQLVSLQIPHGSDTATELGRAPSHGQATCHIVLLPEHTAAAAASYLSACLDACHINADGSLTHTATFPYTGSSVHARQKEAHAHHACVSPDGRYLYVCDLGSDCLWKHPLSSHPPFVSPAIERIHLPAGEGPRHMVFDAAASRAYVIAELTGRLLALDWLPECDGALRFIGSVEGLPNDYSGQASGAAIALHPSGKAVLTSQRQHNSIAFFKLPDTTDAALPERVLNMPCGGLHPRDLMIDRSGRWLFVANQDSDTITVFELDTSTGLPLGNGSFTIETETPVCVLEEV